MKTKHEVQEAKKGAKTNAEAEELAAHIKNTGATDIQRELERDRAWLDYLQARRPCLFGLDDGTWEIDEVESIENVREAIDAAMEAEDAPKDCPACRGVGELPGDPNTKQFPICHLCGGSGKEGEE